MREPRLLPRWTLAAAVALGSGAPMRAEASPTTPTHEHVNPLEQWQMDMRAAAEQVDSTEDWQTFVSKYINPVIADAQGSVPDYVVITKKTTALRDALEVIAAHMHSFEDLVDKHQARIDEILNRSNRYRAGV